MKSHNALYDPPAANERLAAGCLSCLEQCAGILDLLTARTYSQQEAGCASIGAHVRHVLDRYQCFFAGLGAVIDYDARQRDPQVESNLAAARFALNSLARRLRDPLLWSQIDDIVQVRESVDASDPALTVPSTVGREMLGLISHSIHHLAIIAMLLRSRGFPVNDQLGKAPSTLRHERHEKY